VSSDRGLSHGRGRGLRFIYEEYSESPTLSYRRGTARTAHSFCALTRGLPVEGDIAVPRYYSMSLRFAATHASAEEGQEDAYTCFQQMRALFDTGTEGAPMLSEFSKWRVDFSNPCPSKPHIEHIVGGRPHDCGAARWPARLGRHEIARRWLAGLGQAALLDACAPPLRARCLKRGIASRRVLGPKDSSVDSCRQLSTHKRCRRGT